METLPSFIPSSEISVAGTSTALPRGCTFTESDWRALASSWYPVAHSHDVTSKPLAARLLDERVVVYRLSDGSVTAARDICYHRGVPLSLGHVEGDEIVCRYHGLRYDRSGRSQLRHLSKGSGCIGTRASVHCLKTQVRLTGSAKRSRVTDKSEVSRLDEGNVRIAGHPTGTSIGHSPTVV